MNHLSLLITGALTPYNAESSLCFFLSPPRWLAFSLLQPQLGLSSITSCTYVSNVSRTCARAR